MKIFRMAVLGAAFAAGVGVAAAQSPPIPSVTGPQEPGQLNATLNTLIRQINAILSPLIPTVPGAVNLVSLTPGTTGNNATIGLQAGADTNAGITINPSGSGNIQLFADGDTGVLKFGNASIFHRAGLLTPCPGNNMKRVAGTSDAVQGHIIVKDWLDRKHGVPVC